MTRVLVLVFVAGCLPSDQPATPAAPPDPLVGHWAIFDHVLAPNAEAAENEAFYLHDRVVEITAGGYTTPWHGTCGEAGRQSTTRAATDVSAMLGVDTARFKLAPNVVEYQLTCVDNKRTPPLTIYLAGEHAMTCWNGACYLARRR